MAVHLNVSKLNPLGPLILAAALIFTGCAQMSGGRPSQPDIPSPEVSGAVSKINELKRVNQTLHSFSGVGKLIVKRKGRVILKERAAWIGEAPDKLSLVVFISGFPTLRFASDGTWFYLIEPNENGSGFQRIRASDSALSQIIGIEITFAEVIALMRGTVPLADHDTARLKPGAAPSGDELTVTVTPIGAPIVIGPNGGSYQYDVTFANNGDTQITSQIWITLAGPGVDFTRGPLALTLDAGASRTGTLTQNIPSGAPAGT